MFAISPTDNTWFAFLKSKGYNSYVNFWTPTPWDVKGLKHGDRLYFMLKSPIRKIGGFGEYVDYKNMSAASAWNTFGLRNGISNRSDFIGRIQGYLDKNSQKYGGTAIAPDHIIGNIILTNCEFWDEEVYKDALAYGVEFPIQIVKIKYFKQADTLNTGNISDSSFELVIAPRDSVKTLINSRSGQGSFKGAVLRAYNNTCCVTGETTPELLEAAHIQGYKNTSSNHVQNGLIMRVDVHRLYDNNLIYIDESYSIHVSSRVTNKYYQALNGKKITLPLNTSDYPSKLALAARNIDYRR